MSQLRENAAYARLQRNLRFAQSVLLLAMLAQSPYLVRLAIPTLPLFNVQLMTMLWFASAVFAIAGFLMVYRQLDLARDDARFAGIDRFIGPQLQASLKLFFLLAFLVPILNLPATIWAWFQAQGAVAAINRLFADQKRQRERRDKFRP